MLHIHPLHLLLLMCYYLNMNCHVGWITLHLLQSQAKKFDWDNTRDGEVDVAKRKVCVWWCEFGHFFERMFEGWIKFKLMLKLLATKGVSTSVLLSCCHREARWNSPVWTSPVACSFLQYAQDCKCALCENNNQILKCNNITTGKQLEKW